MSFPKRPRAALGTAKRPRFARLFFLAMVRAGRGFGVRL